MIPGGTPRAPGLEGGPTACSTAPGQAHRPFAPQRMIRLPPTFTKAFLLPTTIAPRCVLQAPATDLGGGSRARR